MNIIRIRISGKAASGKTVAMDQLVKNLLASGHSVKRWQEGANGPTRTYKPTGKAKNRIDATLFEIKEITTRK